eukprot:6102737-Alexandrium_andersonii.AAC.1
MELTVVRHCRNHNMVMMTMTTMVVVVAASPKQTPGIGPRSSRWAQSAPFVRAERKYGNRNIPGARLRLVLD